MIVDKIENLRLYEGAIEGLKEANDFLEDFLKGEKKEGKYEIDGENVFAFVSRYEPNTFSDDMKFEAHRKYIDLQAIIEGDERIDWANLNEVEEVSEEFSKGGDIAFYKGEEKIKICLHAGEAALLLPLDAHKPGIRFTDCKNVLKAVVKIRVR